MRLKQHEVQSRVCLVKFYSLVQGQCFSNPDKYSSVYHFTHLLVLKLLLLLTRRGLTRDRRCLVLVCWSRNSSELQRHCSIPLQFPLQGLQSGFCSATKRCSQLPAPPEVSGTASDLRHGLETPRPKRGKKCQKE